MTLVKMNLLYGFMMWTTLIMLFGQSHDELGLLMMALFVLSFINVFAYALSRLK